MYLNRNIVIVFSTDVYTETAIDPMQITNTQNMQTEIRLYYTKNKV